jgi:hypothetical protein
MSEQPKSDRPRGTVTIRWSGVFADDWRTNPHRPNADVLCDPGMSKEQLVRLLRFVAEDVEAE